MMGESNSSAAPVVVVGSGELILDAAGWVGHACWSELRFHQLLTDWLALEASPALVSTFWAVRAHRAELARALYHRLPELREFPRGGFVKGSPAGEQGFAALAALTAPADGMARSSALHAALSTMADHYRGHARVAVGPADGPTADTLVTAITRTEADLVLLTC